MNSTIHRMVENRLVRFLLIGAVNTVFGYFVFFILTLTGLHYSLTVLLSTVAGVLFNFLTISRVVFRNNENRRLPRFCLVYGLVYVVNVVSIRVIKESGLGVLAIQAILLLPLAVLSYTLNRLIVFRSGTKEGSSNLEKRSG